MKYKNEPQEVETGGTGQGMFCLMAQCKEPNVQLQQRTQDERTATAPAVSQSLSVFFWPSVVAFKKLQNEPSI